MIKIRFAAWLLLSAQLTFADETSVYEADGLKYSNAEIQAIVKQWNPEQVAAAQADPAIRDELINRAVLTKKLARLFTETVDAQSNPELYWKSQQGVNLLLSRLLLQDYLDAIEYPDFGPLAEEQYNANPEKYALVPEKRKSSHLLVLCKPGKCDRDEKITEVESIYQRLENGESFEQLVKDYSQDTTSRLNDGKIDNWMINGQSGFAPNYTKNLFMIAEVGGYSQIFQTRYGFHIVRLDGVQPATIKPYEEVAALLIDKLKNDYTTYSRLEFLDTHRIREVSADEAALEAILSQYEPAQSDLAE